MNPNICVFFVSYVKSSNVSYLSLCSVRNVHRGTLKLLLNPHHTSSYMLSATESYSVAGDRLAYQVYM